jgi:hypothetical protein
LIHALDKNLSFLMKGFFMAFCQIEKGGEVSTLFVPNLTINLTYLCYGGTKLLVLWEIKKKFKEIMV